MNTPETKQIMERFYSALEAIIAKGEIRGIATFCKLYDIDRRNFYAQRNDPNRNIFQMSWLQVMVKDFGVNAEWLLTGKGRMFKTTSPL